MTANHTPRCPECVHHATCERPCALAEAYANQDGAPLPEKELPSIIVVWARHKEARFSDLTPRDGEPGQFDMPDPGLDAWPSLEVTRKRTGIFLEHFFNRIPFEDLAVKYEVGSPAAARVMFHEGQKRLLEIVRRMETDPHRVLARSQRRSGQLSRKVRAFLLAKCFDLTITEVAQVLGIRVNDAGRDLKVCADQVRQGKSLLVFEGEDLEVRGTSPVELRRQGSIRP